MVSNVYIHVQHVLVMLDAVYSHLITAGLKKAPFVHLQKDSPR